MIFRKWNSTLDKLLILFYRNKNIIMNYKSNIFKYIIISICLFFSIGCHFNSTYDNLEKDRKSAEVITNKFYSLLKDRNYTATYQLFSEQFFAATDTQKLNNIYEVTYEKLGPIDSISLEKWQTQDIRGTDSRTDYAFLYKVKHKNYNSEESIVLTKENGAIKIIGYHVNSDGFFQPEKKDAIK